MLVNKVVVLSADIAKAALNKYIPQELNGYKLRKTMRTAITEDGATIKVWVTITEYPEAAFRASIPIPNSVIFFEPADCIEYEKEFTKLVDKKLRKLRDELTRATTCTTGWKIAVFRALEYAYYGCFRPVFYPCLVELSIPEFARRSTPLLRHRHIVQDELSKTIPEFSDIGLANAWEEAANAREEGLANHFDIFMLNLPSLYSFLDALKCRCDFAKVVSIRLLFPEDSYCASAQSDYTRNFHYKVGQFVKEPSFDRYLARVCSRGIHYFEDARFALLYMYQGYSGPIKGLIDSDYILHTYFDKCTSLEAECTDD